MSYFSYSQLALYKRCPKQFWFERIQKVHVEPDDRKAYMGHVLGGVVARFYSDQLWREGKWARVRMAELVTEIGNELHATVNAGSYKRAYPWMPGERAEVEKDCLDAILPILTTIRDERLIARRVDTEVSIEVPLDTGDIVVGSADLVFEDAPRGRLSVIDVKAGMAKNTKADQLRLYQLGIGMHKDFGRLPDRVGFWFVRQGKVAWKRTNRTTLRKFVEGVKGTIARIRRDDFTANPGDHCRWCPHRQSCEEGMESLKVTKTQLASDEAIGWVSL